LHGGPRTQSVVIIFFQKGKGGWYQKARPAQGKVIASYNSTQQNLRNNIEYISKCNRIQQTHTIKQITQHQKRSILQHDKKTLLVEKYKGNVRR